MTEDKLSAKPPYAERHVRWCEREGNESRSEKLSFPDLLDLLLEFGSAEFWDQLQNPVEMLKSNTNKNHHPKCPTSQIIFWSIIGGPEARGLLLTPARRTRSGRRPGQNAIQTEYKPGTGGLWFNRCLYHSSPVPGLSI